MTDKSLRWQLDEIDTYPGDLWRDWQSLCDSHHGSNPMLDAWFAQLLIKHFGSQVRVLGLYANGSPKMLVLVEKCGPATWQGFRPSQAQVALVVADPACRIAPSDMVAGLPGMALRLDLLGLDPREHSPLLHEHPSVQMIDSNHDICVDVTGSFEDYWDGRSRNLRKNIRRHRNRLEDEVGPVRLVVSTTPNDVSAATDRYGMIEARGWKGKIGTALHPDNRQGEFYRELMAEMATQSRAWVFELEAGGRLLASRLCVTGSEIMVILKTTFDEDYRRYGVGRLLLHDVIEYVFRQQTARTIDFYTDASRDQLEWATSDRQMRKASFYRGSIGKRIADAARLVMLAKRRLRHNHGNDPGQSEPPA